MTLSNPSCTANRIHKWGNLQWFRNKKEHILSPPLKRKKNQTGIRLNTDLLLNSSRMPTTCLPTIRISVATTRCQYRERRGAKSPGLMSRGRRYPTVWAIPHVRTHTHTRSDYGHEDHTNIDTHTTHVHGGPLQHIRDTPVLSVSPVTRWCGRFYDRLDGDGFLRTCFGRLVVAQLTLLNSKVRLTVYLPLPMSVSNSAIHKAAGSLVEGLSQKSASRNAP